MQLTMFRVYITAWRALYVLAMAASLWSSNAAAQGCSDYPNSVLDCDAGVVPPSQLQIDRNCTIRNHPTANPQSTNFSFLTQPGQTNERWLVVFDNVVLEDKRTKAPGTQFVNTAKWDFGTFEIATP